MNIYLITQEENIDYDTYDSAVVVAPDEDWARKMHPSTADLFNIDRDVWETSQTWARRPENVTAKLIGIYQLEEGEDPETVEPFFVCRSFNAG